MAVNMRNDLARIAAEAYLEHPVDAAYISAPATGGHDWIRVECEHGDQNCGAGVAFIAMIDAALSNH